MDKELFVSNFRGRKFKINTVEGYNLHYCAHFDEATKESTRLTEAETKLSIFCGQHISLRTTGRSGQNDKFG